MSVEQVRREIAAVGSIMSRLGISPAIGSTRMQGRAEVEVGEFGEIEGKPVHVYSLRNASGAKAKVISYGATLTELWMPDRSGRFGDVVLGFDSLEGYRTKHPWFGATVGRVANRIAGGKFTLDGKEYSLEINDPPHSLHSGPHDFSRVVWRGEIVHERNGAAVRFSYESPDSEQGFPGRLSVTVLYRLTNDNELQLEYTARTDQATPVNLTNHSYFNLDGDRDILGDVLEISAESYTPVDATLIPTGEIRRVEGTPLDFRQPTAIGARIAEIGGEPGGYDHNFVLSAEAKKLKFGARVFDESSGRQMEVWTTEPGMQFYSGNFLDGTITGKRGVRYGKHSGFCLETQHYPDAVHRPEFPSIILRPGWVYSTQTIYRFSAR